MAQKQNKMCQSGVTCLPTDYCLSELAIGGPLLMGTIYQYFIISVYSQRVVAHWNALPESVIDATSINSFKNRLNNHWKNIEVKFVPDFYGLEAGISRNDNVMDLRGQF